MGLPLRSSTEVAAIINKSLHAIADLGLTVVNAQKRGVQITNAVHRDNVFRLIMLRASLQGIIDENGNLLNYYTVSANEKKLNAILDGLVHLSKSFDGPSIQLLGSRMSALIYYPGASSGSGSGGSAGGGPATPGGTVFQASVNSPSTLVDTFNASISSFAFYIISASGSGVSEGIRTSIVAATWRGSNTPVFNELKTEDVAGTTSPITFKVELVSGMIQLNAYTSTDGWVVSGVRILFQNISFVNPLGPLPIGGTTGQFLVKSSNLDYQTIWKTLTANLITDLTASATEINVLHGILSTTAELNVLHGLLSTTVELNVLHGILSTVAELNLLHGVTTSTAQLNFLNTLNSNVQTQINTKLTDVMTTIGDIIIRNGSNVSARLGAGSNGQVLAIVGGVPAWQTQGSASGNYTPSPNSVTNCSGFSMDPAQWLQVGNSVSQSGHLSVSPIGAGLVQFEITLPVASSFTHSYQVSGIFTVIDGSDNYITGVIFGKTSTHKAEFQYKALNGSVSDFYYQFTYTVV